MPKSLTKPPLYRLTLTNESFLAYLPMFKNGASSTVAVCRHDGKWDIAITYNLLDQLQSAALPKENLSDTVLRIMKPKEQN